MLGKIQSIEEVRELKLANRGLLNGKNGSRLGMGSMINALCGYESYDGYKVKTSEHDFHVLISNGQSCCESWGYFSSDDDLDSFNGKELAEIELTDKALNVEKVKESGYYDDAGGIQFVTFKLSDGGLFQLAVYNAHNGYYGHPILIAKDGDVLSQDTL